LLRSSAAHSKMIASMKNTAMRTASTRCVGPRQVGGRHSVVTVRAQASEQKAEMQILVAKRNALMSFAGVALASAIPAGAAFADGEEYTTFFGLASPPTSYGGYGGNAKEVPKYSFEYPTGWKSEVPSKVEKGTQGIDGRVVNPRVKDQRAFVITLTRAGEDNKSFRLTDIDSTFAGFAGADYDLQDALSNASNVGKGKREVDGIEFYDYDIESPDFRYLSSIAVKNGKVFALFVRCPSRSFKASEDKLRHIVSTFKLL